MDKLSKRVGRLQPDEVVLSLEIVEYEGCIRVRCNRGWVGMETRTGKVKLVRADREVEKVVEKRKVMPGVSVGYVQKVTEGADALFDDEEERACQLLALRGCSHEVCKAICAAELAAGCPARGLFDHIKGMADVLLQRTIADVTAKVAAQEEAAGRLEEASALMVAGDYGGALGIYDEVLSAHPQNDEASRGAAEAKKGQQIMAMMESGAGALDLPPFDPLVPALCFLTMHALCR